MPAGYTIGLRQEPIKLLLEASSGKGLVYYLKLYLEGLAKFFEQNELRQAEH